MTSAKESVVIPTPWAYDPAWPVYVTDILPLEKRAGLNKSLTLSGLVNHGASRWPTEWEAVLSDRTAVVLLTRWLWCPCRPNDLTIFDIQKIALEAVSKR